MYKCFCTTGRGCATKRASEQPPPPSLPSTLPPRNYTMLCYAMLSYTIRYHTILYYTILYYTLLYSTLPPISHSLIGHMHRGVLSYAHL